MVLGALLSYKFNLQACCNSSKDSNIYRRDCHFKDKSTFVKHYRATIKIFSFSLLLCRARMGTDGHHHKHPNKALVTIMLGSKVVTLDTWFLMVPAQHPTLVSPIQILIA